MKKTTKKEYINEVGIDRVKYELPDFYKSELTDNELLHVGGELSAYEEAIAHNKKIKERMDSSIDAISDGAIKIVDAMCNAYDLKKESVDKIRDWRKVVEYEYKAINSITEKLFSSVTKEKIKELNDLSDAIERLSEASKSSIFKAFFNEKD